MRVLCHVKENRRHGVPTISGNFPRTFRLPPGFPLPFFHFANSGTCCALSDGMHQGIALLFNGNLIGDKLGTCFDYGTMWNSQVWEA
jgi:hypothetical protein